MAIDWANTLMRMNPEYAITKEKMVGVIIGQAIKFMRLVQTRSSYLNNSVAKQDAALFILKKESQKAFIFCNSIDAISALCEKDSNILPYHSKLKEKEKKQSMYRFLTEPNTHIASSKSLILGFDLDTKCKELKVPSIDVSLAVNVGGNSSKIDSQQKSGRVNRLDINNLDKVAKTYNLYIEDFELDTKKFTSQDKIWLKKATAGVLTQIKDLNEI
jgi:hypothetical protein